MTERRDAALEALVQGASRVAVAGRMHGDPEERMLRAVVDAAAALFGAEAASIALHEPEHDLLAFVVAAGARGNGVIGLTVPPGQGIVGYVFSTGEAIALSDVASDPRFDAATAARTGYVPRSIAAVPLIDREVSVGVLQVLDKRDAGSFSLEDMGMLEVFATQAAAAIGVSRLVTRSAELLRSVLRRAGGEALDPDDIETLLAEVSTQLGDDEDGPFWGLVDRIARLRDAPGEQLELVADILEAVARHQGRRSGLRRHRG